jgi:predicted naringenin-chalcone synthase
MTAAHINRIGTAVPPHQVHDSFVRYVRGTLSDPTMLKLFDRMVARAGIERRYSFLQPEILPDGRITDTERFYGFEQWPSTAERMERYARTAPLLAVQAIKSLSQDIAGEGITHLIVASCTGFIAPGLDQLIIDATGMSPDVERTVVGFMGCYAAVNSLRLAHHIVRSTPEARVLVVTVELCSLHFQRTTEIDRLLSMLLFGDGAAAALVTAETSGIELIDFRAANIAGSAESITWKIGNQGFDMHLGGEVPLRIAEALSHERVRNDDRGILRGQAPADFALWAVHAGGRTILDAVERAFALLPAALARSRSVLRDYGNMSSATLMFVLSAMLDAREPDAIGQAGLALAFGPGLAAESFRFRLV